MRLFLTALLAVIMLSGCSWTRDIQVRTKPVERIPLVLPDADRYHHRTIAWVVITKDNAEEVFAKLAKEGKPIAIIGLAGDDYELLALNTSDQQVLIKQLNSIIKAYKSYYLAVEKRDDKIKVVDEE